MRDRKAVIECIHSYLNQIMKGVFMKIKSQVKSFAKIILFFNLLLFSSQAFTSEKLCELETVVTLQNMNQAGYNGRHGVVVGYVAEQYEVTLVDNEHTVLVPVAKAIRRVGSKVILHGIKSFAYMHLNEKEGTIISYDVESKRYVVQVYCSETKEHIKIKLKEETLRAKKLNEADLVWAVKVPYDDSMIAFQAHIMSNGKASPEEVREQQLQQRIKEVVYSHRRGAEIAAGRSLYRSSQIK